MNGREVTCLPEFGAATRRRTSWATHPKPLSWQYRLQAPHQLRVGADQQADGAARGRGRQRRLAVHQRASLQHAARHARGRQARGARAQPRRVAGAAQQQAAERLVPELARRRQSLQRK